MSTRRCGIRTACFIGALLPAVLAGCPQSPPASVDENNSAASPPETPSDSATQPPTSPPPPPVEARDIPPVAERPAAELPPQAAPPVDQLEAAAGNGPSPPAEQIADAAAALDLARRRLQQGRTKASGGNKSGAFGDVREAWRLASSVDGDPARALAAEIKQELDRLGQDLSNGAPPEVDDWQTLILK